jgi:peptidyl-prolyl cis-trans isomerase B (cyclophilin B)
VGTEKRARQKANRQARLEAALTAQVKARKKRQYLRIGVVGVVIVAIILAFAFWPKNDDSTVATGGSTTTAADSASTSTSAGSTTATSAGSPAAFAYGTADCPPATPGDAKKTFTAAPKQCIDAAKTYTATIETSAGTIVAKLDTQRTPGTTNNFVTLARWKYYDSSKLFRTDTSIGIIQGGGQTNTDTPGYTIPDEGGKFSYTPGDLVMARTSQPNSAGGQFFFAVNDNTKLLDAQGTYVTFGKVTQGMDVLQKVLASGKAPNGGTNGAPDPEVTVTSVRIAEA